MQNNKNKSDRNFSNVNYYRDVNKQLMIIPPPHTWSWKHWRRPKWNGQHQLLPFAPSPSISACTTSTNLSSLDFQSNSTIYKKKGMTLEENLRHTIQEIEPLQHRKDSKDGINFGSETTDLESSDVLCQSDDTKGAKRRRMLPQLIAAIAVSWVSMVIGYASAYTSPATLSLKTDLHITDYEVSWICGLMPLSALFGGLMGGPLIEFLGRKWTLLITDGLFLVAWIINYFCQHYWQMYLSRVIVGSGVGIATLTLPVYLGETIQPEVRGSLGLLPTAFGNIGILICYLLGNVFEWRGLAGIGILLPIPFLVLIWLIPETPRWYMSKGKIEEARTALEWLRGKSNQHWVDKEFEDLMKSQKISDEKSDSLADLFSKTNVKSLLIVLGLMFFQQMSGINAVIFYTTQIFKDAGSTLDPSLCTTIVGVVNFISTFIATVLIDRAGRKALLYISSSAMIVTLGILGAYFYLMNATTVDVKPYGWVPLANMVIYVLGFSLGYGPIPWLMMGEILPAKIRGPAASVATGFNWTCTFIVTTTFPQFIHIIGPEGAFWMFCVLCAIGLVFTILFVPETRGQSLEDIERKLAGIKVRRMSSVANLKPLQSTF